MRVVGYVRVSTDKQADSGLSIEAQKGKIRDYCKLYEHELVSIVEDEGASAKTLDRDGLHYLLNMLYEPAIATPLGPSLATGIDAVVVAKLDRLTRSVRDLDTLISEHFGPNGSTELISIGEQIDTSNTAGRMVLNILMSVSQWEREAIGERTQAAMDVKKSRGERVGSIPYGWQVAPHGPVLVEEPTEQHLIASIFALRRNPKCSLRDVANAINTAGYTNRSGNPFQAQTIKNIIKANSDE